jgi:type I restriction enzyme, S subunit
MNEWKEYKLGEIVKFSSGGTPSKSNEAFWGGDIPWISASSMEGYSYSDSTLRITDLGLKNGSRIAPKNSILLLVRGSILHQKLQVGIVERDVSFNQDVKCLQPNEEIIDSWFLLFWLKSEEKNLLNKVESTGIGAGKLDTLVLKNLLINVPPIHERKKLNEIFKAIQTKIELNRQMNQTLEAMAQALFKSWFVDFDPVLDNAMAKGNDIPDELQAMAEKRALAPQSKKLITKNPKLSEEFPSSFVFNETLGKWIPEGWEVKKIKDFGNVICGKTPSKSNPENYGGKIPFIKIPNMHQEVYVLSTDEKLSDQGSNSQIKKLLPAGSIAVSCIATIGKVIITKEPSHTNQQINSIVPSEIESRYYLYFYMLNLEKHFHDLASGGSTTLNMNTSTFSAIEILDPRSNLLAAFYNKVDSLFAKILLNQENNAILTKLRDTLLPELISGRVRVPN